MKFTLGWLKEHLDTDADVDTIATTLTRIGLEVEGVENAGAQLGDFVVARVLTADPHPNADKLQLLTVDAGGEPLQVVCGAPNARAGLVGVFGPPGAHVPGSDFTLSIAQIRGVTSHGMMCSTRELDLGEEHDGIIELPADAPVGTPYPDYAGLNDPIFDIAITPNRQDCMGVRGIARDLAAAGLGTLKPLHQVYRQDTLEPVAGEGDAPRVATEDAEGCPAFFAQSVRGLTNGDAPDWMRRYLVAIGQKPISALVDITNFVSNDLGRPLHVYDMATLSGPLVARKARAGESVLALNGRTYTLDETMTVIADDAAVHDIGGIMGGEESGVSETTTDVLIECAFFDPDHIARTGQKLALTSDARQRFERGVDPAFLDEGLSIATRLVLDHCGGTPSAITRAGEAPLGTRDYRYDPNRAETLGGLAVAPDRQRAILESLGFTVSDDWRVTPPTWRRDIDGTADLVEEVIRIEGIDKVESVPLSHTPGVAKPTATPEQKLERRVRRAAAARGLDEAVTWSFLSEDQVAPFGGGHWTLANPISEELKIMRPSLLPGLLAAAQRNLDRDTETVRLFEIGRRYLPGKDGASLERPTVGIVLAGDRRPRGWREGKAVAFDAFDAKAEAMALLTVAGAPVDNLQVMPVPSKAEGAVEEANAWHPGQSGTLRLGPKTILATFGMLHPRVSKAFDLDAPVAAVELYLDGLPAKRASGFMRPAYAPPALQSVIRDFAFLVPVGVGADTLVRAVRSADKQAIVAARVFDVFTGQGVDDGMKSIAVEVVLQPGAKSFTDDEIKAIREKILAAAAKQGAVLRG
jgi:phenylalanyl-tRNA synthetase beta chain